MPNVEILADIGDRPPFGFMPMPMSGDAMNQPSVEAVAAWLEESLTPDELQAILATFKKQDGGKDLQSAPRPKQKTP